MSEMVEVVIDSIRVSLMSQQRIVILREVDQERYLAIWVGAYEAEHLTIALQDVDVSRPLTYNLFNNVMQALNARILQVEVVALRDETFFGNIVVEANGQILNIDSRPSDAINLAARAKVPILVASEVMEAADAAQALRWNVRRRLTYRGSFPHFLRALTHRRLAREGFEVLNPESFVGLFRSGESFILVAWPELRVRVPGQEAPQVVTLYHGWLRVSHDGADQSGAWGASWKAPRPS